jgi:hypothetical protein
MLKNPPLQAIERLKTKFFFNRSFLREIAMLNYFRSFILLFILLIFISGLGGCSSTPTRHLVSDVAMISVGNTSRQEVVKLMGDPDSKRMLDANTEEWAYYEELPATFEGTPLIGGLFDSDGYEMVLITFNGDIVKSCNYRGHDDDEFDWQNDYSWQEIEK